MPKKSNSCLAAKTGRPLSEYRGKADAKTAAKYANINYPGSKLSPYRCDVCGLWHLSPATPRVESSRCAVCRSPDRKLKPAYKTETDARIRAELLRREQGVFLSVYECEHGYGWHLTNTDYLSSLFNLLSNEPIRAENYYVILYLLSLWRGNILQEANVPEMAKQRLEGIVRGSGHIYSRLYDEFSQTIKLISTNGMADLFRFFQKNDSKLFDANFSRVFDEILYRISESQGKHSSESLIPKEICHLMLKIASVPKSAIVYNPFAGMGSFAVFMEGAQGYFGEEKNKQTWAIGTLRLLAYDIKNSTNYKAGDSIQEWPEHLQSKPDLLISAPPFGLPPRDFVSSSQTGVRSIEHFLIENGLNLLSDKGKLIILIPQGFLFKSAKLDIAIRKHLVESGVLEKIVSLPAGVLTSTAIPVTILVLNKAKSDTSVNFVDGAQFAYQRSRTRKVLDYERLIIALQSSEESEFSKEISAEQIRENEFNLLVNRYFLPEFAGEPLSKILDLSPVGAHSNHEFGKMVRIGDLSADQLDYKINLEEVSSVKLRRGLRRVSESCILLATRWKSLKPTFFSYDKDPIYISNDILAFRISREDVSIPFLIYELGSEAVNEQLQRMQAGVIPRIVKTDLLGLKVLLPTLPEQVAKIQGLQEISNRIVQLQNERNNLAHGISKSQFEEFASLKHTLGRPRQNIIDWTDNLLDFLKKHGHNIQELSEKFSADYDKNILEAIEEIKKDANFMSEVLEKGENGLVLDNYSLELITLSEINAIVRGISSNAYKFKIKKMPMTGGKLSERGISCNKVLLKALLDNVLTNADKHGFAKRSKTNELVIELAASESSLKLEIRNNGIAFPEKYDKEKFITKYKTAHPDNGSGLGGYDIQRIAQYFGNADWDLVLNEDPIFPVKYVFLFPIKLAK